MKTIKRSIVALVCMCLILGNAYISMAASDKKIDNKQLFVDSINTVLAKTSLCIKSGTAKAYGKISGKPRTEKVEMILYLEKCTKGDNWSTVKSWSITSKGESALLEKSLKLVSKGVYRCKMKATVTKDGLSEISYYLSGNQTYK